MTRVKVALVGCGKAKQAQPAPARALYTGGLFRASPAEAEAQCGAHVYVVSAEHGLLRLAEVVAPYDTTLRDYDGRGRLIWGRGVVAQLRRGLPADGVELYVYAGRLYVEPLQAALPEGWTLMEPLKGLGQGRRLAELKRRRLSRAGP